MQPKIVFSASLCRKIFLTIEKKFVRRPTKFLPLKKFWLHILHNYAVSHHSKPNIRPNIKPNIKPNIVLTSAHVTC